jgi:hypothetical protein
LAIDDNGVLTDAANWILSRSHAGHRQDRNERRNQSKLFHFLGSFFACLEGNVPHDLRKTGRQWSLSRRAETGVQPFST